MAQDMIHLGFKTFIHLGNNYVNSELIDVIIEPSQFLLLQLKFYFSIRVE